MEFIFQVLAQLFSPVDENQQEQVVEIKKAEEDEKRVLQAENSEHEDANLFGLMEFH